jgi:hypothetical protein
MCVACEYSFLSSDILITPGWQFHAKPMSGRSVGTNGELQALMLLISLKVKDFLLLAIIRWTDFGIKRPMP